MSGRPNRDHFLAKAQIIQQYKEKANTAFQGPHASDIRAASEMHPTKDELETQLQAIDPGASFPPFNDGYIDESSARSHGDVIYANDADRRALLEESMLARETELSARQTRRECLRKIYDLWQEKWMSARRDREATHRREERQMKFMPQSSGSSSASSSSSDESESGGVLDTDSESEDSEVETVKRRETAPHPAERPTVSGSRPHAMAAYLRQSELLMWCGRSDFETVVRGAIVRVGPFLGEIIGVMECPSYVVRKQRVEYELDVALFMDRGTSETKVKRFDEIGDSALTAADVTAIVTHPRCPSRKELREAAARIEATRKNEAGDEQLAASRFKSAVRSTSRKHIESVLHEHRDILKRIEKEMKQNPDLERAFEKQQEKVGQLQARLAAVTAGEEQTVARRAPTNEERMQRQLEKLSRKVREAGKKERVEPEERLSTTQIADAIDSALGGGLFGAGNENDEDTDDGPLV